MNLAAFCCLASLALWTYLRERRLEAVDVEGRIAMVAQHHLLVVLVREACAAGALPGLPQGLVEFDRAVHEGCHPCLQQPATQRARHGETVQHIAREYEAGGGYSD